MTKKPQTKKPQTKEAPAQALAYIGHAPLVTVAGTEFPNGELVPVPNKAVFDKLSKNPKFTTDA